MQTLNHLTLETKENIEAYALGAIGAVKGVYEVYKPTNTQERIETAGLLIAIGGVAVALYHLKDLRIDFTKS